MELKRLFFALALITRDYFRSSLRQLKQLIITLYLQFLHEINNFHIFKFFWQFAPKWYAVSFREFANKEYEFGSGYAGAIQYLKIAFDLESSQNMSLKIDTLGSKIRIFDPGWVANIGHTSLLAQFPKLEKIGFESPSLKIVPYTYSPNPSYLQLLSQFFTFVKLDQQTWTEFQPFLNQISEKMGALSVKGKTLDEYEAFNQIERSFRECFGISASLFDRKSLEIPEKQLNLLSSFQLLDSKFVGFHIRDSITPSSRSAGNCDIATYVEAIKVLLDQNIRVVIQGNNGMKLLPDTLRNHPLIWDYAHDDNKHPSLDLYFMSHAFFLVGSASGPITIGNDFGVRTLYTNLPCLGYHYDLRGYSLPHLIINKQTGQKLSYSEIIDSPLAWSIREETSQHIRQRNSAQEIKDAVIDMLKDSNSSDVNCWHSLKESQQFGGKKPSMTIAPSFYSMYQEILNS